MTDETTQVEVRLIGVPLRVRARAVEYDQDLLRELALIRVSADIDPVTSAPARLLGLADEVRTTYAGAAAGPEAEMEAALERGADAVDVVYSVPAEIVSFIRRADAALEELEEFSRDGRYLLILAPPPDVAAFRRWVFREFERQIAGEPPTPWAESSDARVVRTDA